MATYCTLSQVQEVESVAGVNLRVDDNPAVYPLILARASRWLDLYLLRHYAPETLAANEWAQNACSWKAAQLFCKRRNNPVPSSVREELEELKGELEAIAAGRLDLPGAVRRRTAVPVVSLPSVRVGPFGPRVVVSRTRGSVRRNPAEDYRPPGDVLEPPYDPSVIGG